MKYYFIRQPSDKNIIGVTDGGDQAEIIESHWKNKAGLRRYKHEYILGIEKLEKDIAAGIQVRPPVIEYIKLRPKAILTDFLSFSEGYHGGRFLVLKKVENNVRNFNVNCRFYTEIGLFMKENKIEGYSNFHLLPLIVKFTFDFPKCIFYTGTKLSLTKKLHTVDNYEEYKQERLYNIELLALKVKEVGDLDMFTFDAHPRIYISERLKNEFEKADITGIEFHLPEEPTLQFS